jgi:peptidoglycan/xylan/chitin deacetylase (PgdA/CDA1 family)
VLCYHDVADAPGDPSSELVAPHSSEQVMHQLRHLRRSYRIVPAADVLTAMRERRPGGRLPVAITFDDDLPCHAGIVLSLLEDAGAPATFFLTGRGLDGKAIPWWVSLQAIVDNDLQPPQRERIAQLIGCAPEELERAHVRRLARRIETLDAPERAEIEKALAAATETAPAWGLRSDAVRRMAQHGHEIGFHTLRHDPLPALADEALELAMRQGTDALEQAAGRPLRLISYPHGKADARVAAAADAGGFVLGFTGSGCAANAEDTPWLVSRIEPTWLRGGRFELQLARTVSDHAESRNRPRAGPPHRSH